MSKARLKNKYALLPETFRVSGTALFITFNSLISKPLTSSVLNQYCAFPVSIATAYRKAPCFSVPRSPLFFYPPQNSYMTPEWCLCRRAAIKKTKQSKPFYTQYYLYFIELSHQRNIYVYIFLLIIARNCKKRNAKSANTHKIIKKIFSRKT